MTARLNHTIVAARAEFDEIFARITERGLPYWADPFRRERAAINHWDDGRGLYFDDPNGHLLEIITKPYGSTGTEAREPHPLIASKIEISADAKTGGDSGAAGRRGKQGGGSLAGAEQSR